MIDNDIIELRHKIQRGEIDINNNANFLSALIKGLIYRINEDIKIRNIVVPHFILNTGDGTLYYERKGQNMAIEPIQVSNEDFVYNQIPRCMVTPKGVNISGDQLTSPYVRGVFEYESDDSVISFNAEFRRLPLKMNVGLKYYFNSFTDSLEAIQQILSKWMYIQPFQIQYMGQTIQCSFLVPESLEEEYNIQLDGFSTDSKYRTLDIELEVEASFPVFNNRTVAENSNIIGQTFVHPIDVKDDGREANWDTKMKI